jgi:hypothetical protein
MPDVVSLLIQRTKDTVCLSMDRYARSQKTLDSSRRRLLPPMQGGSNAEYRTDRETRSIEKTLDGRLPASGDTRLYVGHGTNGICAGCDAKITSTDLEHETDQTDTLILRFHADCYNAWKAQSPSPKAEP